MCVTKICKDACSWPISLSADQETGEKTPDGMRRNVITPGVELNSMVGHHSSHDVTSGTKNRMECLGPSNAASARVWVSLPFFLGAIVIVVELPFA